VEEYQYRDEVGDVGWMFVISLGCIASLLDTVIPSILKIFMLGRCRRCKRHTAQRIDMGWYNAPALDGGTQTAPKRCEDS
jgi:hypothetical protein